MKVIELQERIKKATAFVSEGKTEQAICAFKEIISQQSDFEPCYSVLCDLYLKAGRADFPDEWIKRAVKFDTSFNETFLTLASELQSQGNISESARILSALLEANPDNHRAKDKLSTIHPVEQGINVTSFRQDEQILPNTDIPESMVRGEFLPMSLDFAMGNKCNASCLMCDGSERWPNVPPKWRTVDEVKKLIEGVKNFRSVILDGENCEPFINKNLIEIIRVLKSKEANVTIITNGSLLSKPMIEGLIDAKLNRLIVSIHGARKETAESIMQKVSFENVISSIIQTRELKAISGSKFPQVDIMFVGMKRNIGELSELVALAGSIGVTGVVVKSLMGDQNEFMKSRLEGENLIAYPELLRNEYKKAQLSAQKNNVHLWVNDPYNALINNTRNKSPNTLVSITKGKTRYCLFPFSRCHLRIDDTVNLCCSNVGRFLVMGNAAKDGLGAIWNSQSYVTLRKAILTGENLPPHCDKCDRATEIEPFVMQMDIALRQVQLINNRDSKLFVERNMRRYSEYVRELEMIGVKPIKLNK